jgi:hypothetical protein
VKKQRRKGDMKKPKAFTDFVLYLTVLVLLGGCGRSVTEEKTGRLELTVSGLTGVDANIIVTGPSNFNQTVKASRNLENLATGDYTFTAADVIQSDTYFPDKRQQSGAVKAGKTTSLTVTYRKQDVSAGSLEITVNGLPASTNAHVIVTGPNGFN